MIKKCTIPASPQLRNNVCHFTTHARTESLSEGILPEFYNRWTNCAFFTLIAHDRM
jgi:hypothetical protein